MRSEFGTRPGATSTPPRLDIQGIRALAVGLVIAGHAGASGVTGGFVGVDVFFVVSGYLITMLLLREALTQGRVHLLAFYARRARRILPAATVVLVAVTVYAATELSVVRARQVVDDVVWSAFFAANIRFSALGTDYGAQGQAASPVQHYWSLSVEEQFYLVWPVVLGGVLGVMLHSSRASGKARPLITLGCLTAVIWTGSLCWAVSSTQQNPTAAYFATPLRAWELATGALLAIATVSVTRVPRWLPWVLVPGGLLLIGVAATTYTESTAFPGLPALPPVLGTAALLGTGAGSALGRPSRLLTFQPLPWLGDLSYSLYLWHWPVLTLGSPTDGEATATRRAALVLVVLGLSVASYYLVENPIRRTQVLARSWQSLVLWPVALGAVMLSTSTVAASADRLATVREQQTIEYERHRRVAPAPLLRPTIGQRIDRAIADARARAPIPYPLVHQARLGRDLWHHVFRCSSGAGTTTHKLCPVGQVNGPEHIAVYGDSHAGMWLPALVSLGERLGYRVTPFVKYGCSPFHAPLGDAHGSDCARYHAWALDELRRTDPDVIVVGSRTGVSSLPDDSDVTWGSEMLLRHLSSIAPVKVLGDVSGLPFDPADCATDPDSTLATCLAPEQPLVAARNGLLRAVTRRTGADFLDTATLVCRHRLCPVVVGNVVTFGDDDHVSVTWARRVARELGERLGLPEQRRLE